MHHKQTWFKPRPGNLVGRVPSAIMVMAALGSVERRPWPENPWDPAKEWLDHAMFEREDHGWLYGPVKVGHLCNLTNLSYQQVSDALVRLRKAGILKSYRPPGWSFRNGIFYELYLPIDNPIQNLTRGQVRAKARARERSLRARQAGKAVARLTVVPSG